MSNRRIATTKTDIKTAELKPTDPTKLEITRTDGSPYEVDLSHLADEFKTIERADNSVGLPSAAEVTNAGYTKLVDGLGLLGKLQNGGLMAWSYDGTVWSEKWRNLVVTAPTVVATDPEYLAGTETTKSPQVKQVVDEFIKTFGLLGLTRTSTDWGAFTEDVLPDNATSLTAILQVVETKLNQIELLGDRLPSAATFAGLPATTAKNANDWTSLTADDVGTGTVENPQYPKGLYVTDGTNWSLFMSLKDVLKSTLAELEAGTDTVGKTHSSKDLTDWINAIRRTIPLPADNKVVENAYIKVDANTALDLADVPAIEGIKYGVMLAPNIQLSGATAQPISHTGTNFEPIVFESTGVAGTVRRIGGNVQNILPVQTHADNTTVEAGKLNVYPNGTDLSTVPAPAHVAGQEYGLTTISADGNNYEDVWGYISDDTKWISKTIGIVALTDGDPNVLYRKNVYFLDDANKDVHPAGVEGGWFEKIVYQVDRADFDENQLPPAIVERFYAVADPATPTNFFWVADREHDHEILENIAVHVRSAGTNAGSAVDIELLIDGAWNPTDWVVSTTPVTGLTAHSGATVLHLDKAAITGPINIGHNKDGYLFFEYVGDAVDGQLTGINYTGTNGANSDGEIIVNFAGTNQAVTFANKAAVVATDLEFEQQPEAASSLEIVRYTADGAIQDKDHRAIFETGAVNMTLAASTTNRLIQMVSEGPVTIITANGAEEFTSSGGTSTDQKLTINETFKWATIIGRTAGGWSQYVGQVGLPAGVDESTPTKFKAGTRLVQNGIDAASGVTFPEPFKVGTIPTIRIVAQDTGDNVNVTLQTVTNTGFTSWVVRNESDVGIGSPTIHWEATGEVA